MNRRSFLKAASIAPIAAPFAAGNLANGGMMKALLGMGGGSLAQTIGGHPGYPPGEAKAGSAAALQDYHGDKLRRIRKMLGLGLPDWLKRQHRQEASHTWMSHAPEVLSLRSVSDIAKREIAISRTERKLVAMMEERPMFDQAREKFCKEFGWDW